MLGFTRKLIPRLDKEEMRKNQPQGEYVEKSKMNYLKMLDDINELVDTDFVHDMELRMVDGSSYTKEEAHEMETLLSKVYLISHAIRCKSCGSKYR